MSFQVQLRDHIRDQSPPTEARNALNPGEVLDVLRDCQRVKDRVVLWTVSNQFPHLLEVSRHVHALYLDRARGGILLVGQHLEGGRFTSAVDTEQREAFAFAEAEGKVFDGAEGFAWVAGAGAARVYFTKVTNFDLKLAIVRLSHSFGFSRHVFINLKRRLRPCHPPLIAYHPKLLNLLTEPLLQTDQHQRPHHEINPHASTGTSHVLQGPWL